jgi:CHAD domain-containing protein
MAYRFDAGQSIPDEIRRVFFEEVDSAIGQLTTHATKNRDESIHEARKSVKKLRGLLRLVTPLIGRETYRKENQALRDIGRKLSQLRDARVTIEIFEPVAKQAEARKALDSSLIQSIRGSLEDHKSETEQKINVEKTLNSAVAALQTIRSHVNDYHLAKGGELGNLERGLEDVYRRGRKAMKRAVKTPGADNFHNWRKRVKDHWYHIRLLGALDTAFIETREDDLKKLETWLGDDHNLVVLQETISGDGARFGHPKQVRQFLAIIKQLGKELRQKALDLGEHLYGLKPKQLMGELGRAREIWPAESGGAPATISNMAARRLKKKAASEPSARSRAKARA